MQELEVVRKAIEGDRQAFSQIVERYHKRVFAFAKSRLRNDFDTDEAVQNTFVKCFMNIRYLKEPSKVSAWLFVICRNEVIAVHRRARVADVLFDDSGFYVAIDETYREWTDYSRLIGLAVNMLNEEQREVIQLKYFAGLSMKQIAVTTQLPVSQIKSRLYEGRQKIKQFLPQLSFAIEIDDSLTTKQKERVMKSVDVIKLGAYVFARLSLAEQTLLCQVVHSNQKFGSPILEAIGKVDKGVDFLSVYEGKLTLSELINILSYGDSFTEYRLIEHLDGVAPEISDKIKQNMFVFDDLVLFDPIALKKLLNKVDPVDMQIAMSIAHPDTKRHIYSALGEEKTEQWKRNLGELELRERFIYEKQFEIIEQVKALDQSGELVARRDDHNQPYPIMFTS
jgi:RNA polymerase sigma factor (sigma-70 family)